VAKFERKSQEAGIKYFLYKHEEMKLFVRREGHVK
jgi:hypothetical protein